MLAAIAFAGCTDLINYEERFNQVDEKVENLEERVTVLEELCRTMNSNISALQTLVAASQENDCITSVSPITESGEVVGYTINFAKGESITIYHGEDGRDGEDGVLYITSGEALDFPVEGGTLSVTLQTLNCYNNQLTSLRVPTGIQGLNCSNNQLTTLDLEGYAAVRYVNCEYNLFETLDVSPCMAMTSLNCSDNKFLKILYMAEGQSIDGITYRRSTSCIPEATEIVVK